MTNKIHNLLQVKVQPRARTQKIIEIGPQEFKVWVQSPPEKGRANKEVLRILSDYLELPLSRIRIIKGQSSRQKTIRIE